MTLSSSLKDTLSFTSGSGVIYDVYWDKDLKICSVLLECHYGRKSF